MPTVEFHGGPLNGETWDLPQLVAGQSLTYRTESAHAVYQWAGDYRGGHRLYYLDGVRPRKPSPWPDRGISHGHSRD